MITVSMCVVVRSRCPCRDARSQVLLVASGEMPIPGHLRMGVSRHGVGAQTHQGSPPSASVRTWRSPSCSTESTVWSASIIDATPTRVLGQRARRLPHLLRDDRARVPGLRLLMGWVQLVRSTTTRVEACGSRWIRSRSSASRRTPTAGSASTRRSSTHLALAPRIRMTSARSRPTMLGFSWLRRPRRRTRSSSRHCSTARRDGIWTPCGNAALLDGYSWASAWGRHACECW